MSVKATKEDLAEGGFIIAGGSWSILTGRF